jgi:hypothetical protein
MTINNPQVFMDSLWDWGCLDTCFDNGIKVSDLDGIVERRGRFLVLETKSSGVTIPTGQQRMFNAMASSGLFCIMVIWGEPGKPERVRITTHNGTRVVSVEKPTDLAGLREMVERWYRFADTRLN